MFCGIQQQEEDSDREGEKHAATASIMVTVEPQEGMKCSTLIKRNDNLE